MGQDPVTHGKLVGNIRVIEFLTVLGADVNAIDTSVAKTTPLIEAARAGKREACEVLIKHGANVRFKDAQGDTAIHWAARRRLGHVAEVTYSYQ